jgi:Lon protease-like protein
MRRLPMFPLGTVLLPTAMLPLHVFEPRYRALMSELTDPDHGPAEFGVVLISRGAEVGGGDQRVEAGTSARLVEASLLPDGRWIVVAVGTGRFRVLRWLDDDPYPLAEVCDLDEDTRWSDGDDQLLATAERAVRRSLALAAEMGEPAAPLTFELAEDPVVATWQLASVVPVGPLDRQQLLETSSPAERLRRVTHLADDVTEVLALRLGGGQ